MTADAFFGRYRFAKGSAGEIFFRRVTPGTDRFEVLVHDDGFSVRGHCDLRTRSLARPEPPVAVRPAAGRRIPRCRDQCAAHNQHHHDRPTRPLQLSPPCPFVGTVH
jgi:hypothetical protein